MTSDDTSSHDDTGSNDIYSQCSIDTAGSSDLLLQCVASRLSKEYELASAVLQANMLYSRDLYLILAAAMVFFMQAGFAMVCAGAVRRKNLQNTMLKNLLDACGASVAFWSVGYAFAFGDGSTPNAFVGTTNFFLMGVVDQYAFWVFQYAFSAAAATIVAGTLAERCQMNAYFYYSVFLTGWVYPVVVHVIWSNHGLLSPFRSDPFLDIGVIDVAGSGVVHLTGGFSALIAAWVLGPRRGRFHDEVTGEVLEKPKKIAGHSVSLQMIGTLILWFCWYGFNSGSVLLLDTEYQSAIAALAATNTTLAAGAAGITALIVNMIAQDILEGKATYDLEPAMNGVLSGLVAITAGCGVVEPWAAAIIGAVGGLLYLLGSWVLIKCRIDDAVNAIPVHMVCGSWGMIAVGLIASPERLQRAYGNGDHPGLFYGLFDDDKSTFNLLAVQLVGVLFIIGWTTLLMLPFFSLLASRGMFRSSAKDEVVGLDKSFHGGIHNGGDGDAVLDQHQRLIYQQLVEKTLETGYVGSKKLSRTELEEFRSRASGVLGVMAIVNDNNKHATKSHATDDDRSSMVSEGSEANPTSRSVRFS